MALPGSDTAYCTADDLKPFIDKRVLAAYLSDSGQPLSGDPFADTVILPSLLLSISGTLESACLVGAKYTADELANLTAASKNHMMRILAGLLMDALRGRRDVISEKESRPASWAQKELEALRKGYRIFSVPAVQDARAGTTARDESPPARQARNAITTRFNRYYGYR